jgi:hypothetical protein
MWFLVGLKRHILDSNRGCEFWLEVLTMLDIVGSSFVMAFGSVCDILRFGVLVVNVMDCSHGTSQQTMQTKIDVSVNLETFMS